jgi:hypothetical protein
MALRTCFSIWIAQFISKRLDLIHRSMSDSDFHPTASMIGEEGAILLRSKQISPSDHDLHSSQYSEFKGADTNAVHVIRYLKCHSMMPGRNIGIIGQ